VNAIMGALMEKLLLGLVAYLESPDFKKRVVVILEKIQQQAKNPLIISAIEMIQEALNVPTAAPVK